jgi:hypothetical protein
MPFHGTNAGPSTEPAVTLALWQLGDVLSGPVPDLSGNSQPLAIEGVVPPRVSGPTDFAWRLGSGDTALVMNPSSSVWTNCKESMSVEMAVRLPNLPQPGSTTNLVLFSAGSKYDDAQNTQTGENCTMFTLSMDRTTRKLRYFWDTAAATQTGFLGTYVLPYGEWVYLAVVRNYVSMFSSTISLWVNGSSVYTSGTIIAPLSSGRTGSTMGWSVGCAIAPGGTRSFKFLGDMDSIRISKGIRTSGQISDAYTSTLALGVPPDRRRRNSVNM